MKILYLFLITFSIATIKPAESIKPVNKPDADSTLIKLKAKKAAIDNYLNKHSKQTIVLVKTPGKKNLMRVMNEKWPDEIDYTINLLKDKAGKVIFIEQSPYSESGDWDIVYRHYFDGSGNTIAFYRSESIFDDNIKGGVARKELLKYYDQAKSIAQISALLNVDWKPLKAKESDLEFRDYKYNIYKNLKDCLAGYGINSIK